MSKSAWPERLYIVKLAYLYLFFGMVGGLFMCLMIVAMNQPIMFFAIVAVGWAGFIAGNKISGLRFFISSICHHDAWRLEEPPFTDLQFHQSAELVAFNLMASYTSSGVH